MATDSDACLPQTLTDFIFDLYDSVTLSQAAEEQAKLYNNTFRELSAKVRKRTNRVICFDFLCSSAEKRKETMEAVINVLQSFKLNPHELV
jgi:hypothetical protein